MQSNLTSSFPSEEISHRRPDIFLVLFNLQRMALVCGGRSSLNPNAPLFIPAVVREVEDFSPEWWELINNSVWFHDYWLRQHQGENGSYENDEFDANDEVVQLLPDSIDFGVDDDLFNIEQQFEEFIRLSESGETNLSFPNSKGMTVDAEAMARTLSLSRSFDDKSPKSLEPTKYWAKPAKHVSPRCSPRRIQQPR